MTRLINSFLIFLIFLLLFVGFFHKITSFTQDLGRHLITGQIILQTHQVPKINLFSYTYPQFPFINHHWFSEVIFYLTFKFGCSNLLLILTTMAVLIAFSLVFFSVYKKENIIPISFVSLLYLKILFERTDLRPEIFSFFFLSIFLVILYSYQKKFTKWIFLLPIVELLWVNMHIYFIVGIAVIGLFLIETFVFQIINRNREEKKTKRFKYLNFDHLNLFRISIFDIRILILLLVFLFSILATLINPNGLNGATYPLRIFQNYGYSIEENQNVFFLMTYFQKVTAPYFLAGVIFLFLNLIIGFRKSSLIDWLLSIFFTILGITAVRNFPLFVFGTFIPLTKSFSFNFERINNRFLGKRKLIKNLSYSLLFLVLIWQIFSVFQSKKLGFGVEKGAESAADFFVANNLKGPIFNNFDIGSYLDYRLYSKSLPAGRQEKVFVDGRPEAYPSSFFQTVYIPMQEDMNIFNQISKKYDFNTIFFSITDQTPWAINFLKQIAKDDDWKIIYLDDYVIILAKNNFVNKQLIAKYGVYQKTFSYEKLKLDDLDALYRLAVFFNRVEWTNQEYKIYQNILNLDPNSCFALYNLSVLLEKQQSPLLNIYLNRLNTSCK